MKILITGVSGFLGWNLASYFSMKQNCKVVDTVLNNLPPTNIDRVKLDISNQKDLKSFLKKNTFDAVIHCAANSNIASCENFSEFAINVNCQSVASIVQNLDQAKTHLIYCSTDMIFDGLNAPYSESANPSPVNSYGKTKLAGEKEARKYSGKCTVARLALMYGNGPAASPSFLGWLKQGLLRPEGIKMFRNEYRTALYVKDAVYGIRQILESGETGVFNIAGPERLSREEFAICYAKFFGLDIKRIHGVILPQASGSGIFRPPDLSLDISRARKILGFSPKHTNEAFEDM